MAWIGSSPNQTAQRTDGVRTGTAVHADQKTAGVKIRADLTDVELNDIVEMIDACMKLDGGNIDAQVPLNGNNFDEVGNAAARDEFASAGQIADGALIYAGITSGDDTVTASLTPAITAYVAGMLVVAEAGGTNTTTTTLNLNGVGAKTVKKGKAGSLDLSAGDFTAGRMGLFAFDGTNLQMLNAPEFPTGTVMLFNQTAAPVGWTKNTSSGNDTAIRLTTGTVGTGGTVAFETAFASKTPTGTIGGTAITQAQLPSYNLTFAVGDNNNDNNAMPAGSNGVQTNTASVSSGGSGATHTHTFTGDAINLDVAFNDVIRAAKD